MTLLERSRRVAHLNFWAKSRRRWPKKYLAVSISSLEQKVDSEILFSAFGMPI